MNRTDNPTSKYQIRSSKGEAARVHINALALITALLIFLIGIGVTLLLKANGIAEDWLIFFCLVVFALALSTSSSH